MSTQSSTTQKSAWKNPFLYTGIFIACVAAFVSYVMLERYLSKRAYEDRIARQEAATRLADDRRAIEQLGGSELAIRGLSVSPSTISPGGTAQLCYDVANAKTVTLEPPVGEVWPSHSRCIDLKTRKTTTFTLTVGDATGRTISQSVDLKVK